MTDQIDYRRPLEAFKALVRETPPSQALAAELFRELLGLADALSPSLITREPEKEYDRLVTVDEAAGMLGISVRQIRRETKGRLKGTVVRQGRLVRFSHKKLQQLCRPGTRG